MRILSLLCFLVLLALNGKSQCNLNVSSSDGYQVAISVVPKNVIAPSACPNGYNFNIEFDYDISFRGNNTPNALFTLQGNMSCGSLTNNFFDLPNQGGIGTGTTVGNPFTSNQDCQTATVESLDCRNVDITINGPGISMRTFNVACGAALPVEFLSFKAKQMEDKIALNWSTATETNNEYFLVQRSDNRKDWKTLGRVEGAGNSTSTLTYKYVDHEPLSGENYYRILQVDFDGVYDFTSTRSVLFEAADVSFSIYPNPASSQVTLTTNAATLGHLRIFNGLGQDVMPQVRLVQSSDTEQVIDVSQLPDGIYWIQTEKSTQKLLKQ